MVNRFNRKPIFGLLKDKFFKDDFFRYCGRFSKDFNVIAEADYKLLQETIIVFATAECGIILILPQS